MCSFRLRSPARGLAAVRLVTTSPCREGVNCAPAAFLGCGSRFSGSLSGTEPRFPVTRCRHGRRLTYRRKLMRQTLEGRVAGVRDAARSAGSFDSPGVGGPPRQRAFWGQTLKGFEPGRL